MRAELLAPGDPRWAEILRAVPHDFYHLPSYARLSCRLPGETAGAFWAAAGPCALLIPCLLRPVPDPVFAAAGYRDAASPYGYPSPLIQGRPDPQTLADLLGAFAEAGRAARVVAAFLRFHPLLPVPLAAFAAHGEVVAHGETTYIDLTLPPAELDRQTRTCHRADARKLLDLGFHAELDRWERLPEFIGLYEETMARRGADPDFFFPRAYYQDLRDCLGNQLHLCLVLDPEGRAACGGLFSEMAGIMQFHLSGTAEAFIRSGAAKLMLLHMRDWARVQGLRYLHLGGGLGCAQDSLAFFKQGFSRTRAPFHTFRMVLDREVYDLLAGPAPQPTPSPAPAFFPAYRSPLKGVR